MPTIEKRDDVCTVIVTVDAPPELADVLAAHARFGLSRFPDFPGFLSGALHLSEDRSRIVQYLQWSSEADYQRCIDDPTWNEIESTRVFMDAVRSGRATLDGRVFRVDTVAAGSIDEVATVRPPDGRPASADRRMLRFDVFGRRVGVLRENARWTAVWLGTDGKHRPAPGISIPPDVPQAELARFLADLFHESASPENPDVVLLE